MIDWFEDLPESCPPSDAFTPNEDKYYRLAENCPPEDKDFFSQRKSSPSTVFKDISECICCSVSIWKDKQKCLDIKKFPRHKNKSVIEIVLTEKDGLLLQTFKPLHFSWWRSKDFQIEKYKIIGSDE